MTLSFFILSYIDSLVCVKFYYTTPIYPKKATYRDGNGVITKAFDFDESGDYEYLYIYENGEIVETKKIG